ncbi:hypothetical protein [Neptunicella marina]|uniref:DUF1722 domain-containing protein n=1 Tax=Neptunicella marina TaxID=2125989 RepID=A0A8J6M2B3_9ALTE|nr:hypothetical protein [Neptunicella marina]MBC3766057.1 hypothetical protein [Neptunicella marina]
MAAFLFSLHPGYLNNSLLLNDWQQTRQLLALSHAPAVTHYLAMREAMLHTEAELRQLTAPDNTLNPFLSSPAATPEPMAQLQWLAEQDNATARIPLPQNAQQCWAQHKYSLMMRDLNLYKQFGQRTASKLSEGAFALLIKELTESLYLVPSLGGLRNGFLHMWGYVSDAIPAPFDNPAEVELSLMQRHIWQCCKLGSTPYIQHSTAITEPLHFY